ncbi:MAG TPA: adenylate/guanylate cyclase domain-containing protein, partial [Armatimonadota bacterium]|nr:adenylate/guanylate cyclase domain-containing protein [Armatimonadota bacterium]
MPERPTGTVTFLFTDIEGSTRLWETAPGPMAAAVTRHDALLRNAVEQAGGWVFKTVGDACCAVFDRPADALRAALEAQLALQALSFDGLPGPLRVRMALHTGTAQERDGDYFGPTVNRVARLLAAGHGGQVLVSGATRTLLREELPK